MSRVLCTGDWQIGAHLNYGRTPEERLDEQEQVLHRVVDLALEHDVALVLIGGDIWERRRPTPSELMAVARPLRRLRAESTCDIVAIAGNHDVENADWPSALEVFGDIMDVHRAPAVVETRACAVATLPYVPPGPFVARMGGGDRGSLYVAASEHLMDVARGLYAEISAGRTSIMAGHWTVTGGTTPTGLSTDLMNEVVLPSDALADIGFDAIALSHIHKRQLLTTGNVTLGANGSSVVEHPCPVFYTGSVFTCDFGEADTPHGVWLLDVGEGGVRPEFVQLESRRFVTLDYDLTEAA